MKIWSFRFPDRSSDFRTKQARRKRKKIQTFRTFVTYEIGKIYFIVYEFTDLQYLHVLLLKSIVSSDLRTLRRLFKKNSCIHASRDKSHEQGSEFTRLIYHHWKLRGINAGSMKIWNYERTEQWVQPWPAKDYWPGEIKFIQVEFFVSYISI